MGTVDALAELVDQGSPEASVRRARLLELLRALQRALRDALLRRVRAGDLPPLSGAEPDLLDRLAAQDPRPEPLERALSHLARLEEEIDQSVNPTLVLEGLVLDVGGALAPPAHAPAAGGRRVRTA